MIKIAIQKSGRLNEESLGILKICGISIDNGKDQLKAPARNFPMEVLYLRNGDIPQYLRDGVVDLAIIGENLIHEKGKDLTIIENLGFSKCRVSIAVPKEVDFNDLKDLNGKRIATSYPNTVNQFLAENIPGKLGPDESMESKIIHHSNSNFIFALSERGTTIKSLMFFHVNGDNKVVYTKTFLSNNDLSIHKIVTCFEKDFL